MVAALRAPPDFLQLVAHPVRWQLLRELARSDRIVQELTELVGESQNLVSYHLGKLRAGRVVSAHRSTADRRDTYYAVDLARVGQLLADTGAALHPGLRLAPLRDAAPVRPVKILFLCTGNSARSPMAEALAKAMSGGAIDAVSAGSHPKPLHPNAVAAMREAYGIDLSAHVARHLDEFAGARFDWVISLCDRVREVCPEFPGAPQTVHWSIANPATGESDETTLPLFHHCAAELRTRIGFLLAKLADRTQGDADDRSP